MVRFARAVIAVAVAAGFAVPAEAATYMGKLYGTITTGSAGDFDYYTFDGHSYDLTNDAIEIDFTVNVIDNYDDGMGNIYPQYVTSSVEVKIPASPLLPDLLSFPTNDLTLFPPEDASFSGDANAGTYYGFGYYAPDPDFPHTVNFTYANAHSTLSPLTGSGTSVASFYDGSHYSASYGVTFKFDQGFVTGPGQVAATPEPAGWALMIVGFGMVGAALRRRGAGAARLAIA